MGTASLLDQPQVAQRQTVGFLTSSLASLFSSGKRPLGQSSSILEKKKGSA